MDAWTEGPQLDTRAHDSVGIFILINKRRPDKIIKLRLPSLLLSRGQVVVGAVRWVVEWVEVLP